MRQAAAAEPVGQDGCGPQRWCRGGNGEHHSQPAATGRRRGAGQRWRGRRRAISPKTPAQPQRQDHALYQPSLNVCTSLATASPLALRLLRTGSSAWHRLAVGRWAWQVCPFPAAWLADRSRTAVIRTAVIISVWFCSLVASISPGDHIHANKQFLCICLHRHHRLLRRLPIIRRRGVGTRSSGSRSRLCAEAVAASLGTAAGPLLAVVVFATVGDHWRGGELEIVAACGACLFFARRCWFGPRGSQPTSRRWRRISAIGQISHGKRRVPQAQALWGGALGD